VRPVTAATVALPYWVGGGRSQLGPLDQKGQVGQNSLAKFRKNWNGLPASHGLK
jgi:hypothetical protein